MVEQKKVEEFLIRLGGALTGGLEDAAFECNYYANVSPARNVFPYTEIHPNLPPCDDLIVGGLAIPPWVIGYFLEEDGKKRGDTKQQEAGKAAKVFGEGDACYVAPMLLRITLVRTLKLSLPTPGPGLGAPAQSPFQSSPSSQPSRLAATIIKL